VTAHPTAEWTAQQLREAFPFDQAPKYLLRDRDRIFGAEFSQQVADLGAEEVLGVPRSPCQRAYVERVIGTIRRECLDHVIIFNEASPVCTEAKMRNRHCDRKLVVFTTAMSGAQPESPSSTQFLI
jgi:hypothetical protein